MLILESLARVFYELHLLLFILTSSFISIIDVSLGCLIEPLEQPLVVQDLTFLLILPSFIITDGDLVIQVT